MKEKKSSFILPGLLAREAQRKAACARAAAQRRERELLATTSLKDLIGVRSRV